MKARLGIKERDVSKGSPGKSILKPPKEVGKQKEEAKPTYNQIVPFGTYRIPGKDDGQLEAFKAEQTGGMGHAVILDDRFDQYLAGQKRLAFESGEPRKAVQNLQYSLQERVALYDTTDIKIWRLSQTIAEIGLTFLVQQQKLKEHDETIYWINIVRKQLEPLPGAQWGSRHDWQALRRDFFKNLAIFYQDQNEWQKAFDALKQGITHEQFIGDTTANTSLTCAVLLSKMNRFAESIEYAQQSANEIEKVLKIDGSKPLSDYKYTGKNREMSQERDKQMTTYAIANHSIAKALLNLHYFKEARFFLLKAQTCVNKCLNEPRRELSVAINNEMARLMKIQRGNAGEGKVKVTAEMANAGLLTIKTDLATRAMSGIGGDRIEQRTVIKNLTQQVEKEEEKADQFVANQLASIQTAVDKAGTRPRQDTKEDEQRVLVLKEPTTTVAVAVNPAQEATKEESPKATKKERRKAPVDAIELPVLLEAKTRALQQDPNMKPLPGLKSQRMLSKRGKKEEKRKRSENVKTADKNLARIGADLDAKGVKYSHERSVKSSSRRRKQLIREVNRELGYSESNESSDEGSPDTAEPVRLPQIRSRTEAPLVKTTPRLVDQHVRREFSYKKEETLAANKTPGTARLLNTISKAIVIPKPEVVQKESSETGSSYSDKVAEEMQRRLERQTKEGPVVEELPRDPEPDVPQNDSLNESFQSEELLKKSPRKLQAEETPKQSPRRKFLRRGQGLNAQAPAQNKPARSTSKPKQKVATGLFKHTRNIEQARSEISITRQRTPPLKKEVAEIIVEKKASRPQRQPTQGGKPNSKSSNRLMRKSLVYQLSKEKNLNTGGNIDQGSDANAYLQPQPQNLSAFKGFSRKLTDSDQGTPKNNNGENKKMVDELRMRQLAAPKSAYKEKELTAEEKERRQQKEAEYDALKQRYKKFDFADFVNRDGEEHAPIAPVAGQFKSRYDDMVPRSAYQAGNKIAQQKKERQIRREQEAIAQEAELKVAEEPVEVAFEVGMRIGEHIKSPMKPQPTTKPSKPSMFDKIKELQTPNTRSVSSLGQLNQSSSHNNLANSVSEGLKKRVQVQKVKNQVGKKLGQILGNNKSLHSVLDDSDVIADREYKAKHQSLTQLRRIEFASSVKIQSMARAYLTRKWYVNLQVRKRLSVPFSGLEFAQNPFLRQFNRVNQRLQAGKTNVIAEIVNMQRLDQRNMIETKRKTRKIDPLVQSKDREAEANKRLEVTRTQPHMKRITKSVTAEQLLEELKQEFINSGLDAYQQFKRLGVGVDFTEQGQAYAEGGIQKVRKLIDERRNQRNYIGQEGVRERIETGDIDPQQLQGIETKEYLDRVEARRDPIPDKTGAAKSTTHAVRDIQQDHLKAHIQAEGAKDFPIESYQAYSREPIVFFKNLGLGYSDNLVKWVIYAGTAFVTDGKHYMPVKIVGKPMKSRSTIVIYTMNLEMIQVSKSAVGNYDFETIWPFILYLFNSWVKHQVTLMGIKRILPGLQDRLPDSNYTMYECHNQLKQDFDALEDEAYKDILNFSSEIELDDKFEPTPNLHPDKSPVIDRSKPELLRKPVRETKKEKRNRLFQEYRNSVAKAIDQQEKQFAHEAARKFVTFKENLVDNMTLEEQLNLMGDNKEAEQKFLLTQRDVDSFKSFLGAHYVRLPKPKSNQYKLMMSLQDSVYHLMEKKGGLPSMQIALMNEERRRIRALPPLKSVDYNCIDRAAIKLRLILDCLEIQRRMSGVTLVPRDLKQQQKNQDYAQANKRYYQRVLKKDNFSEKILKLMGKSIVYEPAWNQKTLNIKLVDSQTQPTVEEDSRQNINRLRIQKKLSRIPQTEDTHDLVVDEDLFGEEVPKEKLQPHEMSALIQRVNTNQESFLLQSYIEPALQVPTRNSKTTFIEQLAHKQQVQRNTFLEKYEIESVIFEDSVLEQGCIRFQNRIYIATLFFKRIHCNNDNMSVLIQRKRKIYQKRFNKHEIMDLKTEEGRLESKPCELVSSHPQVLERDADYVTNYNIKGNDFVDLHLQMSSRTQTGFQSYIELKMCTRLSNSLWADSVQVTWEQISKFFSFFGIKNWEPSSFLKRMQFSQAEAFLFYNYFSECLDVDQGDQVSLTFSLDRLSEVRLMYDKIFLKLTEFEWVKENMKIDYYYPDILKRTGFNECNFDQLVYPFCHDPQLNHSRVLHIDPQQLAKFQFGKLEKNDQSKRLELRSDFEAGQKPDILVDDFTKEYLEDPQGLFNLTLSKYPSSNTLFLGRLGLSSQRIQYEAPLTYTTASRRTKAHLVANSKTKFNVRIDYFVRGVFANLQIRAFTTLAAAGGGNQEILTLTCQQPKIIKDFIRICGQNCQAMVLNQLQSILAIEEHVTGKRLCLNHASTRQKRQTSQDQDIYTMLVINEQALRTRVGTHNTFKFKGILNIRNVSQGFSSVLACITQYDFQSELIMHHGDVMMKIVHGNKHLTQQMIQKNRELMLVKTLEQDPHTQLKVHTSVTMWKIAIMDMRKSQRHDAILTQEDLTSFYECEVFEFFRKNPKIPMPNILDLLQEYLMNLFSFRTQVGVTLAWSLPLFKVQLNSQGRPMVFDPEQVYKVPRLLLYQQLQAIQNAQLQFEDNNKLPVSLDAGRQARKTKGLPKLCLRTRLAIEKVLPIYPADDLRSLKISLTQYRVICQVTKIFNKLSDFHFALITVTLHEAMETWIWTIYFPSTQRTFMVTFYASDLFKLDQKMFQDISSDEKMLWSKIVKMAQFQLNHMGDILLKVDSYVEPIRELLYQTYAYNETSKDIYYQELTLRSYSNYVTDISKALPAINLSDQVAAKDYTISLKAFSLGKEQWIKDYQPLSEVIKLLQQENMLTEDLRSFYYSMMRSAAVLLASKVVFSANPQHQGEVKKRKITYNVQNIINAKQYRTKDARGDPIIYAGLKPNLKSDWQNLIQLNRVIYQAVVANNPIQICSISYNEAKDRFVYRLYRASDSVSIERRFEGSEIMRTCCPCYIQMLRNNMEKELGQRIAMFYHANILVASVLQIHNLHELVRPQSFDPNMTV